MAGPNRYEVLSAALLAAMLSSLVSLVAVRLSTPSSTPTDFVFREGEQRDGPASLDRRRSLGSVVLRLAFVGDIMQHRGQAADDFRACYRELTPLLRECDLAAGNLEFPVDVTRPVGPTAGSVRFNGSEAHVAALAGAGFDVLSTANNHCFDQGAAGVARTLELLGRYGLTPVGNLTGPEQDLPVIVQRNGVRIGFFAYTFRPNSYPDEHGDTQYWQSDWPVHELNFADWSGEYREQGLNLAARHARAARDRHVDWLVALVHWGREWEFQPTADQRRAGHDLVDQGFDLVVGSHGHVLNPLEVYRDRLIAYSLGNVISDFRAPEARTAAVLQVALTSVEQGGLAIRDFRAIPVLTEMPSHRVRPVQPQHPGDRVFGDLARKVLGPACVFAGSPVSRRAGSDR